jgi:hypothetical protein
MIRKRLSRRAFDLDRVGVPAHDPLHRGKPSTRPMNRVVKNGSKIGPDIFCHAAARVLNLQTDGGTGLLVE